MTELLKALKEINTLDIDITVMTEPDEESVFIRQVLSVFKRRIKNAEDFALENRVILIFSSKGIEIDISLGIAGYESESIKRVKKIKIGRNFFPIVSFDNPQSGCLKSS